MNIIDAARDLALQSPSKDGEHCIFCIGTFQEVRPGEWQMVHTPECRWLAMPKIVAALEAAATFVAVNGKDETSMDALMRAEDNMHAAFGDRRRYLDGSQN